MRQRSISGLKTWGVTITLSPTTNQDVPSEKPLKKNIPPQTELSTDHNLVGYSQAVEGAL